MHSGKGGGQHIILSNFPDDEFVHQWGKGERWGVRAQGPSPLNPPTLSYQKKTEVHEHVLSLLILL